MKSYSDYSVSKSYSVHKPNRSSFWLKWSWRPKLILHMDLPSRTLRHSHHTDMGFSVTGLQVWTRCPLSLAWGARHCPLLQCLTQVVSKYILDYWLWEFGRFLLWRDQEELNSKRFSFFSSAHMVLLTFLFECFLLHVVIESFWQTQNFATAGELIISLWRKLDITEIHFLMFYYELP